MHYEDALRVDAGHVDSLAGLGAIQAQQGRLDEAKECYRRAIAMRPDAAALHYNLGRAHEDAGEPADAARCYRRALDLDPGQSHAWLNFGGVMAQLGDAAGAVDAVRRAIALRPDYAAAHNNLGTLLQGGGDARRGAGLVSRGHSPAARVCRGASKCGQRAAADEPARRSRGRARGSIASRARPRWRALQPQRRPRREPATSAGRRRANALRRLCGSLRRASRRGLDYRIPERLAAGIATLRNAADTRLDVLDLGCGTGLFGAAIDALARTLTGVDLSPRMLDKARERRSTIASRRPTSPRSCATKRRNATTSSRPPTCSSTSARSTTCSRTPRGCSVRTDCSRSRSKRRPRASLPAIGSRRRAGTRTTRPTCARWRIDPDSSYGCGPRQRSACSTARPCRVGRDSREIAQRTGTWRGARASPPSARPAAAAAARAYCGTIPAALTIGAQASTSAEISRAN